MSDEKIITGEQALQEGRGSIKLPEPTDPIREVVETAVSESAIVNTDPESDVDKAFKFLLPPELPKDYEALGSLPLAEPNVKTSLTLPEIVEAVRRTPEITPLLDPAGLLDLSAVDAIMETVVKKNKLGTEEFCPDKDRCNHFSQEHCKQAKLEADHRRDCGKGHLCDCFSSKRGIPAVFRGGSI